MPEPTTRARQGDAVESVAWREVQRLRQDVTAVENALMCDAYAPEMRAAASALVKLATTAEYVAGILRNAHPLPEAPDV